MNINLILFILRPPKKPSVQDFLSKSSTRESSAKFSTQEAKNTTSHVKNPLGVLMNPYTVVTQKSYAKPDTSYQPYAKPKPKRDSAFPPVRNEKSNSWDDVKQEPKEVKERIAKKSALSEEQKHVLDLITVQKRSVFFTGNAGKNVNIIKINIINLNVININIINMNIIFIGTGKSFLLREIIRELKLTLNNDRLAITGTLYKQKPLTFSINRDSCV